jgi:uncharacterized membrane protein
VSFLHTPSRRSLADLPVVGVCFERQTYANLAYLVVGVPLGVLYSVLFGLGITVGALSSVVGVGVAILTAVLFGSRLVAGLERRLANAVWPVDLRQPTDVGDPTGSVAILRAYVDAPSTWRGLGFLSMRVWLVPLAAIVLVVLANAITVATAPLRYPTTVTFGERNGEPVTWAVDTAPEVALAVPAGLAGIVVAGHAANGVGGVARRMAVALLGRDRSEPSA